MKQDQIETSLRRLDAAGDLSNQDQQRGEQLLERILGTPFDDQLPGTRRPRRTTRRILAVAAAVSVRAAALLLIQGPGGSSSRTHRGPQRPLRCRRTTSPSSPTPAEATSPSTSTTTPTQCNRKECQGA